MVLGKGIYAWTYLVVIIHNIKHDYSWRFVVVNHSP